MKRKIKIVSKGHGSTTKVMYGDKELPNIKTVMILPIAYDSTVQAFVTFTNVELDVTAEQIREEDTK
jgi:hypothetical protein